MTRAEYEAKYGVAPVAPKVDIDPAPVRMTRAEYDMKYGEKSGKVFGNPLEDIQSAGADVNAAISGTGQYQGQSAIRRGFSAAGAATNAVPTVVADVIPGGKAVLGAVGKVFETGVNAFGNSSNTLASLAEKVGILTPEQRQQHDENNSAFANSPTGAAIEAGASVGKSSGDIANVILMAHGTAQGTQDFIDNKAPKIVAKVKETNAKWQDAQHLDAIQKTAQEIASVEGKYVKGRKAELYSKDNGVSSRERIAQSGVMRYSVDESGMVRTQVPGGAVEQYKAMTTKPAESIVRDALTRESVKVNLSDVQRGLTDAVNASGLQGADLVSALNGVRREIAGLRLKANELGYVDATLLHDAKINTTNNINYQTPPETATYRKAVARGYKTLVEENSSFNVKEVNAELGKFYEDIARLERLDGARVSGGKLGKYTAQISGNIVGGAFGYAVGGPIGGAISTVVGGEIAGLVKGKNMASSFSRKTGSTAPKSPVIEKAISVKDFPRDKTLRGVDAAVQEAAITKYVENPQKMVDEYLKQNGNVVNTDNARKLFEDVGYVGSNSAAVHTASKAISDKAFEQLLSRAKPGQDIFFMAGGSGAGKSTATRGMKTQMDKAAVVFDGNLSNYDSALKKIKAAEAKGLNVTIPYVFRDPVEAWSGVVGRMLGTGPDAGRVVPLVNFMENTPGSLQVVKKLRGDGYIVRPYKNTRGGVEEMTTKELMDLNVSANLQETLIKETEKIAKEGKMTKEQYEALLKDIPHTSWDKLRN